MALLIFRTYMEKERWLYMRNSQHSFIFATVFVCFLASPYLCNANGDVVQQPTLSGLFATELSKNGEVEITTNQEYCSSNKRPLHVNQEMAETLAQALQYSKHIEVKSECQKVKTEKEYQFCHFYFYSPNKAEQWSMGFAFLGKPNDGKIKAESIQCFSTP